MPASVESMSSVPPREAILSLSDAGPRLNICGRVVDDAALGPATAADNCAAGPSVSRGGVPPGNVFPVGTTTLSYTATDAVGLTATAFQTVTVVDDTPPVIGGASATPAVLWSPNHKMVDVAVDYAPTDNCGGPLAASLSISSNEPVNGTGDGDTAPDWEIVDAHHVRLRAERAGSGTGRVYTITISVTDTYGNTSVDAVTVTVPHNQ
ncbi:MAG TPA: HYR domain-containing protein [Vicinamibacteria bacterium]|nr:HYR domain-containing protein [Vicinamibacteria bacterium]